MSTAITDRVRRVIALTFGVPEAKVTTATTSADIETWDSMNHLHLIVALEGEFGVTLDPEEAVALTSVDAIVEAISRRGS